jgi:hypothetical protein
MAPWPLAVGEGTLNSQTTRPRTGSVQLVAAEQPVADLPNVLAAFDTARCLLLLSRSLFLLSRYLLLFSRSLLLLSRSLLLLSRSLLPLH